MHVRYNLSVNDFLKEDGHMKGVFFREISYRNLNLYVGKNLLVRYSVVQMSNRETPLYLSGTLGYENNCFLLVREDNSRTILTGIFTAYLLED